MNFLYIIKKKGINSIDSCDEEFSGVDIAFGSILLGGILISFSLQILKIVLRKSSIGVSSLWAFVGFWQSITICCSGLIGYWDTFHCCTHEWDAGYCIGSILPFLQLALTPLLLFLNFICLIYFFPKDKEFARDKIIAQILFLVGLIIIVVEIGATLIMLYENGSNTEIPSIYTLSYCWVVLGSILTVFFWTPQIVKTYMLKNCGSFSIAMLLLLAPGIVFQVIFFAVIEKASWKIWLPYCIGALQVNILLIMAIYYWHKERKQNIQEGSSPLLSKE
eukprot:TRINITY_DN1179_c0_g1_i1.p1 TRINITY_DN1179_c0_g1~~TRINITY_DN1179_c0_g1_i1.p1  ORF type:complete len:277 (+),score=98.41 TRINITY_DN1179_c0_g1_i1:78-908(+)